jgi:hypothetical protein
MKIEIGESLLLSWLRHIKECQLVQTNWKPSSKWELKHKETLEKLMQESSNVISQSTLMTYTRVARVLINC